MTTFPPILPEQRGDLRIAALLGIAGILATLALFPYLWAMMPAKLARIPFPLWLVAPLQALQAGVLCFALGWIGLRAGRRYELDAPWLRAWTSSVPYPMHARWGMAILVGLATGIVVGALSLISASHAPALAGQWHFPWRGALACFYGGIVEETECRLFLVSGLAWLLGLATRGQKRTGVMLVAIVLAALLFGAGHLPAAFARNGHLDAMAAGRIIALNAIAGLPFGVLFWKRGLEHAMLAHFSADVVLHVALPMMI